MIARVSSFAFSGIDAVPVEVQVQIASGLPSFIVVGLPDKAVAEARERVRAALTSMGLSLPPKRIIVNLAPADLLKEGSHFDLPIALAVLAGMDVLPREELAGFAALGELSLDGAINPVAGVLPAAMSASLRDLGLICPAAQGGEAAWAGRIEVLAAPDLLSIINHFRGTQVLSPPEPAGAQLGIAGPDLAEVRGMESARRAIEVAAAGRHNLLLVGPPGAGKSMLAARLPALLPDLSPLQALEVSMVHSVAGILDGGRLVMRPPFREPHHGASQAALAGGGTVGSLQRWDSTTKHETQTMTLRKPGRIPPEDVEFKDIHFEAFPPGEDLWWVSWFDYGGFGGGVTGTARLRVVLSKLRASASLDRLPTLGIHLTFLPAQQSVVSLQAGWLPNISIGLVIQSGKVVGRLGATTRRFTFSSRTHRSQVEYLLRPRPNQATPADITGAGRLRPRSLAGPGTGVLGGNTYSLNGVKDGRTLSIYGRQASAPEHLLLPCPEVFRITYAPHRMLALALLAGPWESTARRVLNRDSTKFIPAQGNAEARWELALREGLNSKHAAVAGNLWINPVGRQAAAKVWSAISNSSQNGGLIEAPFPFDWDLLEIETAGFQISNKSVYASRDIWFGYAITSIRWPDSLSGPPDVIELLPTRTIAPPSAPGAEGEAGNTRTEVVVLASSPVEATQESDPTAGSAAVSVTGVGPTWWNMPLITRRQPSVGTDGRKVVSTTQSTSLLSAGVAGGRGKKVVTAQAQAADPFGGSDLVPDRFTRVIGMLNRLKANGSIKSHSELSPPPMQAARRSTLKVWAFPELAVMGNKGVERWYMRAFKNAPPLYTDVRRVAMIRSVDMGGSVAYWVEIEQRTPADAYMALIFVETGAHRLNHVVRRLLEVAALRRGVWPDAAEVCSLTAIDGVPGISAAATWRHPPAKSYASGDATALAGLKAVTMRPTTAL